MLTPEQLRYTHRTRAAVIARKQINASSTREKVFDCHRHLVSRGVHYFGRNMRKSVDQGQLQLLRLAREFEDHTIVATIGIHQVRHGIGVNAKLGDSLKMLMWQLS